MALLLKAAGKGDIEKAQELLQHIHFQNKKGESALHVAITEGELSMVEFLCNNGANVNLKEKKGGYTTIMLCLAQKPTNYLAILDVLLKHQPDLTLKDASGQTALHLAAQYETSDAAELLLNASKSNLDIPDSKEMTPMLISIAKGNLELTQLLQSKKHSLLSADGNGNSSLHWACMQDNVEGVEMVNYLLLMEVKFTQNHSGNTPLHAVALRSDPKEPWPNAIGGILIKAFPEIIHVKNKKGKSAEDLLGGEEAVTPKKPLNQRNRKQQNADDDGPSQVAIQNAKAAMMARARERARNRKSLIPEEDDSVTPAEARQVDVGPPVENKTSEFTMAIILALVIAFFAIVYAVLDASTKK